MTEVRVTVDAPKLIDFTCYQDYRDNVVLWDATTDHPKKKRGSLLVLGIPNSHPQLGENIQKRLFAKIRPETIAAREDGLTKILEFLDENLAYTKKSSKFTHFREIIHYKRKPEQKIEDFVREYEYLLAKAENNGMKAWDADIKVGFLMENCNLTKQQRELLNSVVDYSTDEKLYENVRGKMIDMLSNVYELSNNDDKFGEAFFTQHESAFVAWAKKNNYQKVKPNYGGGGQHTQKSSNSNYNGNNKGNFPKPDFFEDANPKDKHGRILKCRICWSIKHLQMNCPHRHKYDNTQPRRKQAFVIEGEDVDEDDFLNIDEESTEPSEKAIFFTTNKEEISKFTAEALNSCALDTCCTASVAGSKWMEIYKQSIPMHLKSRVLGPKQSNTQFTFGNQQTLPSLGIYSIPVIIGDQLHDLEVDIIQSDIPFLMSKSHMKKVGIALDLTNDTATANGKPLKINTTSAGHYIISLLGETDDEDTLLMEEIMLIDFETASAKKQYQMLVKIHKQFGHGQKKKFVDLLKGAGQWIDTFDEMLEKIIDGCEGCILRKRNPVRPSVAFPLSNDFNQCVAMDLKIWNKQPILYMVDTFTRYTIGTLLKSKSPEEVISAMMIHWIRYFQKPQAVITDNGGEFTAEVIREACSKLDIKVHTTPAYSPHGNGTCEKAHDLVDTILVQVNRDFPDMDLQTALAWSCAAKNTLTTTYGFSPYQLVFGRQPALPNIIDEPPPALEVKSRSKALEDQLRALHECRIAFIKSQSCEKLKQALRTKIRTSQHTYERGQYVYFKRDRDDRWMGPGKVIFQDGKVVFIRHGSTYCRIHANRLYPVKDELAEKIRETEEHLETRDETDKGNNTKNKHTNEKHKHNNTKLFEINTQNNQEEQNNNTGESNETHEEEEHFELAREEENTSENRVSTAQEQTEKPKQGRPKKTTKSKVIPTFKKNEKVQLKIQGEWKNATIASSGKRTGKYPNWYNFQLESGETVNGNADDLEIRRVEEQRIDQPDNEDNSETRLPEEVLAVLADKESRNSPEMKEAKQKELQKLKDFHVYDEIPDEGQEHITTTWVLTKKGDKARARLTARGFQEQEQVTKDSPTMHKFSLRILLIIAAAMSWTIATTDVQSAFLQGDDLDRTVLIKPPKEAEKANILWILRKCLYGLRDASKKWYNRVESTLKRLGFKKSDYDSGVFYYERNGKLEGVIGIHVDDFLHCGTKFFNNIILPKVLESFKIGKSEANNFTYTGFHLLQDNDGITLDQESYVDNIKIPFIEAKRLAQIKEDLTQEELTMLRQITGTINWTVRSTRPDLAFDLINLSTKFQGGQVTHLKEAKKVLTKLKDVAKVKIPNLGNLKEAEIWTFSDASHGNLNDGVDSTGGFITLLVNPTNGKCAAIEWKSGKINRKTRSSLASEVISANDAIDAAIATRKMLKAMLGEDHKLMIRIIIDNKDALESVHSSTDVQERRLRRDIAIIKECLATREIEQLIWVPGSLQLADVLTKKGVNPQPIRQVVQTGVMATEHFQAVKNFTR